MSALKPLGRLLALAWPLKWWMALAALLGIATVGSGIGLMATSAYLISLAALHPSVAALGVAIVGVRFFGISRGIFRYLERYVSHSAALRLLSRLRVWFYSSVEPSAPAGLVSRRSGDLLSRVVSDIETLQDFYVRVIAPPVVAGGVAVLMSLLLSAFDPRFAIIFLGFYLLAGVGVPLLAHHLSRQTGKALVEARAELQVALVEGIQGLADLLAFGREHAHQERIARLNGDLLRLQRRLAQVNAMQIALATLLMNAAAMTLLVLAVPLVRDGTLDGLYLAVLVLATLASMEAVLPLPLAATHLGASLAAAQRLFEIAGEKGEPPAGVREGTPAGGESQTQQTQVPLITVQPGEREESASGPPDIDVQHLTFSYSPGDAPALRDVSFRVPARSLVALVGPSGAGKSTIANLLLRFWERDEGTIKIGGRDLSEMKDEELRALFAVVAQDTHLFNTTIRGNLMIARPEAGEEDVQRAVRLARLDSFVAALPQGLDTPVGEHGLLLSGGERQRVAIARAFLQDAPVLLLDEPAANLDPLTERDLFESLRALAQGRTTLIITHRLVGLETAGEVLVLRDGAIVERGTHQALLARGGFYSRMWRSQADLLAPTTGGASGE